MAKIEYTITDSSCISGFSYDENGKLLSVKFKHGGIYDYPNVEKEVVTDWAKAESKGKYFNRVIKKYSVNA